MNFTHPLWFSTDWLRANLDHPQLRILDTTIYLRPNPDGFGYKPENGREEWQASHIPGAGFVDVVGELSDADSDIPLMMPAAEQFAASMAAHGVSDDSARGAVFKKAFRCGPRGCGGCCARSV